MNRSYLTEDELVSLLSSDLHRESPYLINGVSNTQLSIARHYGGCKAFGYYYTYNPITDELIRDDVLKWIGKERKKRAKERLEKVTLKQGRLF